LQEPHRSSQGGRNIVAIIIILVLVGVAAVAFFSRG
jgi:hypothetical protein